MNERSLVSIIVPTLNEEDVLPPTLTHLQQQTPPLECIVVDGGSSDATRECASDAGATVVQSPSGRGTQLNRGAREASGDLFLFLHADTLLPANGLGLIRTVLNASNGAGTFQLQFDDPNPLLHFYSWWTRWPWIHLCFGDRGLFTTRSAFEAVGGYPEWPLFEDLELASRLYDHGDFHFLNATVTTSARRFQRNGILRQQLRNAYLWLHYIAGGDPEHVAHLYNYQREPSAPEGSDTLG